MPELKIGIHLPSLRQSFQKALLTVAPWRIQGVEIDARHEFRPAEMTRTAVRDVRRRLEDQRLRIRRATATTYGKAWNSASRPRARPCGWPTSSARRW